MSLFVAIEGVEGAGKSTLRARLSELLSTLGPEIVITREPGATPIGVAIRNLLLDSHLKITSMTELMLFCADRAQHLEEVIRPALKREAIVLCDRFIHSTIAYQGYGRGMDLHALKRLTMFVTDEIRPDLVLLLDLPVEHGLKRAERRAQRASGTFKISELTESRQDAAGNNGWTRFEEQELDFHRRVRNGFLEMAKDPENRISVLDASEEPEALAQTAFLRIRQALAFRKNSHVSSGSKKA